MLLYRIAQTVLPDTYIIKEDVIYIHAYTYSNVYQNSEL